MTIIDFFQSRFSRFRGGFTLVETIVAVFLISFALVAPITAAQRSLTSARNSRDQMTAYFLAEEGLEYVHYRRDLNAIENPNDTNKWLASLTPYDNTGKPFGVDPTANGNEIINCQPITKCLLYFYSSNNSADHLTGVYSHQNSSGFSPTIFTRSVQIFEDDHANEPNERRVKATVSWKNNYAQTQKVELTGYITNWKEQVNLN